MININDERFEPIAIEEVTTPREGYRVITNSYWESQKKCVFGFKLNPKARHPGTPQCNKNRKIVENYKSQESTIVFLPVAYWPQYPDNY